MSVLCKYIVVLITVALWYWPRPSNGLSHLHRNFLSVKHTTVLAIPKVFVKFERKIQYLNNRAREVLDFKKKPTVVAAVVTFQSRECSP